MNNNFDLKQFLAEGKLLKEGIQGLITVDEDGNSVIDSEVYENTLKQEAERQGIELDQDKLDDLIDELINGGYEVEDYADATPEDILDDYNQWANY